MKHQITKSFSFRAANGSVVGLTNTNLKAMDPNTYHYGKVFYSDLTGYKTPKGSPLQVDICTILSCKLCLHRLMYCKGQIYKSHNVAQRYRNSG